MCSPYITNMLLLLVSYFVIIIFLVFFLFEKKPYVVTRDVCPPFVRLSVALRKIHWNVVAV